MLWVLKSKVQRIVYIPEKFTIVNIELTISIKRIWLKKKKTENII